MSIAVEKHRAAPGKARDWTSDQAAAFMAELRAELRELGVFRGDKAGYIVRSVLVLAATAIVWFALLSSESWPLRGLLVILAGYLGVQASAIAHEAGHGAVTRDREWMALVGQVFMTAVVGASFSAWCERHGTHHVYPNSTKDPDVRPGLFRFNETDARTATGLAGWTTRHQHLLLFPLATLMGFSLKFAGWKFVLRQPVKVWVDLALSLLHASIWLALPAMWIDFGDALLNYALLTWVEGAYLAFVFLANHLGGPTGDESRGWPPALRQIVTARNLPNAWWLTHLCIGLNTHIEHHLFSNLPSSRLPEARATTRRMCLAHGIPYRECGVLQAFAEVYRHSRHIASIARIEAQSRITASQKV